MITRSVSVLLRTSVWLEPTSYWCLPPLSALSPPSSRHPVLFQTYCRDLLMSHLTAPALRLPLPPSTPVQRGWWDVAPVPSPPAGLPRIPRWRPSSPRCLCSLPRPLRPSSYSSSGLSCPSTAGETRCASFGLKWQHQGPKLGTVLCLTEGRTRSRTADW